jgi:hypothetical protein
MSQYALYALYAFQDAYSGEFEEIKKPLLQWLFKV